MAVVRIYIIVLQCVCICEEYFNISNIFKCGNENKEK